MTLVELVREYQEASKTQDDARFSAACVALLDYKLPAPTGDTPPTKDGRCQRCGHYHLDGPACGFHQCGCRGDAPTPPPAMPVGEPMPDYKALYHELLYQVGSVFPGESRHETALRYLIEHEDICGKDGPATDGRRSPEARA